MKNSTELIVAARKAIDKMLRRCLERLEQPSYLEMFYEGYAECYNDLNGKPIDGNCDYNQWHYIDAEGLPEEDERCIVLLQCDGYKEWELGRWNRGKNGEVRWELDWEPPMAQVIAWHKIPEIPE